LEPGSYIVLPRTTGCALRGQPFYETFRDPVKLLVLSTSSANDIITRHVTTTDGNLTLSYLFDATVMDIFARFNSQSQKMLFYNDFKQMCEIINKPMSEETWKVNVLPKF